MDRPAYIAPAAHGRGIGSTLVIAPIAAAHTFPEARSFMGKIEGSGTASISLHAEHGCLPGVGYKPGRHQGLAYLGLEL